MGSGAVLRRPIDLDEPTLQERPLRQVGGELQRPTVRIGRLRPPAEPAEQVGPRGVQVGVRLQGAADGDLVHHREASRGSRCHGHGDGEVQAHDR